MLGRSNFNLILQLTLNPLFVVYLLLFGLAGLACLMTLPRVQQIEEKDTRQGLTALLITTGVWSLLHVAYFIASTTELQIIFYTLGLIVGISAVIPWVYFCSAYTGRLIHRNTTVRYLTVIIFLVIVLVKLTNPFHHLYFTYEPASVPFQHLEIHNKTLHWVVMGLAYSVASIGFFMLFEMFAQVGGESKPIAILVSFTGLPVILDVLATTTPYFIELTHSPLGVAIFAIGVSYVYFKRFQRIKLAGEHDDAIIILDDEGKIRDYNSSALDVFPSLLDSRVIGERLDELLPEVMSSIEEDQSIIELSRYGSKRYYRISSNPFGEESTQVGETLTFTDVTEREQYRRELERQNQRLEDFASMVSHDLRNPLNVAQGRLEIAREENDSDHLVLTSDALNRMEKLIDDLLTLARQGKPIDKTDEVVLSNIVDQCWEMVDTHNSKLVFEDDIKFMADPDRLRQMIENLVRNAIEHGGNDVTIYCGGIDGGFYVEDDGSGISEEKRSEVFEFGFTTNEEGTGFGLSIVKEIVDAHGWEIDIKAGRDGGARFEITDVNTV